MFRQFPHFLFSLILIFAFALGCSSGSSPVLPDTSQPPANPDSGITGQNEPDISPTVLWGYFDMYFDLDAGEIVAVPNRSMEYATNVVVFLNNNPLGVTVDFHGTAPGPGYLTIDMDVSITHPMADEKFNGYDVRGIFIGNGSDTLSYNPDLTYPVDGVDQVLLNADGYTRWWNPSEFTTTGFMGYTPGILASKNYSATATLNGYKYFGEGIGATDDLIDHMPFVDGTDGSFIAGTTNTRNYRIRFMVPTPGVKYGYAVVANWKSGQPADHPSHAREAVWGAVGGFPYHNYLYYVDETHYGGWLDTEIFVFDWNSVLTDGVMEDYSLILDSSNFAAPYVVTPPEMIPEFSYLPYLHVYHVHCIPDQLISNQGDDLWLIIEYDDADYTSPFGIPNGADTDPLIAAYKSQIEIHDTLPIITIAKPNGGEEFGANTSEILHWVSSGFGGHVNIYYSKDDFVSDINIIEMGTSSVGVYLWDPVPEDFSSTVKIKVESSFNPEIFDVSDDYFSIVPAYVNITYPAGGEEFLIGSSETILYDYEYVSGLTDIYYSKDGFTSDNNLIQAGVVLDGSYDWNPIPDDMTSTASIRIIPADNPGIIGTSAEFTIYKPWIEVTSPNGGENWTVGSARDITWTSDYITGTVFIEYSTDNFVSDINSIAIDEPNDGTYTWDPIPLDASDTVTVRISSTDDPTVSDRSDGYFSLTEGGWAKTWADSADQDYTGMSTCFDSDGRVYVAGSLYTVADGNGIFINCYNKYGQMSWGRISLDPGCTGMMPIQLRMDGDENLVFAGGFRGTVDFDMGTPGGEHTSVGGLYAYNAMVVKYTKTGAYIDSVVWPIHTFQGLALDGEDNIYVCGGFDGTNVDLDPDPVDDHLVSSNGGSDVYVVCLDSTLDFLWATTWGGTDDDGASSVVVNVLTGDIYISGVFSGTDVDFDPGAGIDLKTSLGLTDCFLARFDSAGTYIDSMTWGGTDYDVVESMAVNFTGLIYTGGTFSGSVDFDPDPVDTDIHTASGSSACFISSFGPDLEYLVAGVVESDGNDNIGDIVTGMDLSVYIYGTFDGSTIDLDPGPGTDNRTGISHSSWLVSLGPALEFNWGHVLDYTGADDTYIGLAAYQDKAVAVTGVLNQTTNLAPSEPPCNEGPDMHGNPMYQDGYLIKYLSNGCWKE